MKIIFAVFASAFLSYAWGEPKLPGATLNSYKDLIKLIQGNGTKAPISSLDAFLDRLATDYPGTFNNYSLVYASRSLQSASPVFPRVVLFGQGYDFGDTRQQLILAFTGDSSRSDYNSLEVLSMDDNFSPIRLSEVRFEGSSHAAVIDEKPPRCLACHGAHSRPIWDSYPIWPGVYFGDDFAMDARIDEISKFLTFKSKLGKEGRYKHLPDLAITSPEDLQITLNQFSIHDVAEGLTKLPLFSALKFAFLGAGGRCLDKGPDGWFSPAAGSAMDLGFEQVNNISLADISANVEYKTKRYFNVDEKIVPTDGGYLREIDSTQQVSGVRYVSLLAGDDMRSWSKSLSPQALSFATRGLDDFFYAIYDRTKTDKVVLDAVKLWPGQMYRNDPWDKGTGGNVDCEQLADASRAAVTEDIAKKIGESMPAMIADLTGDGFAQRAPILRCISCHTDPLRGPDGKPLPSQPKQPPFYPFDQPTVLGSMLAANNGDLLKRMIAAVTEPADSPTRMPKAPRPPLTAEEQAAFTDLIGTLAAGTHSGWDLSLPIWTRSRTIPF